MLSVVQIIGQQRERAEEGLRKLLEQEVSEPLDIVLVDLQPESGPLAGAADSRVRVVPRPGLRSFPRAMAAGAEATTGDCVAFIEDHCHAQPGWAAAVMRAFERGVEIVNYAFIDAQPETYLSRSFLMVEYGRWLHPVRPGAIPIASCANIAYRRDVLMKYAAVRPLEEWFQAEYMLHRRIQGEGGVVWQSADAIAAHEDWMSVRQGLYANGALKRFHAATIAFGNPPWSLLKRWMYGGGMVLVPGLQVWRLVRSIVPRPMLWGRFVMALPITLVVTAYQAASEAAGYLLGPGDSEEQFYVAELEWNRK